MHARIGAALAALLLMAAASLSAQAKPNLTGEWTLVPEKSDFGPMPKPTKMVRTATHTEPALKFVTVQSSEQGETTAETNYTTDGKPTKNTVQGNTMTSTAKWDGATLVITSTLSIPGKDADGSVKVIDVPMSDRIELSADGKTMNQVRTLDTPEGQFTLKLVFAKK
jgi:hypothetical protein